MANNRQDWMQNIAETDTGLVTQDTQKLQGQESNNNDTVKSRFILKFNSDDLPSGKYHQGNFPVRIMPTLRGLKHGKRPYFMVIYYNLYNYELPEMACLETITSDYSDHLKSLKFELYKMAKERGGKESPEGKIIYTHANRLWPKTDLLYWGVMRTAELLDEETGKKDWYHNVPPKIGRLPKGIAENTIVPMFHPTSRITDILNIKNGRDLLVKRIINRTSEGNFPKYDGTIWDMVATPLSENESEIGDWIERIYDQEEKGLGLFGEYEKRIVTEEVMKEASAKILDAVMNDLNQGKSSSRKSRYQEDGSDDKPIENGRSGRSSELVEEEPRGRNKSSEDDRRPPRDYQENSNTKDDNQEVYDRDTLRNKNVDEDDHRSNRKGHDERDSVPAPSRRRPDDDGSNDDQPSHRTRPTEDVIDRDTPPPSRRRPDDDVETARQSDRDDRGRDDDRDNRGRDDRSRSDRDDDRDHRGRSDRDGRGRDDDRDSDDRVRSRSDSKTERPEPKSRDSKIEDDEEFFRNEFDAKLKSQK